VWTATPVPVNRGVHPLQRGRRRALAEQPLAVAQDHRVQPQPVLVDEAVPDQGLRQPVAAVHLQFAARLLLELPDPLDDVVADDRGAGPVRVDTRRPASALPSRSGLVG
jgi:hypothetical protein